MFSDTSSIIFLLVSELSSSSMAALSKASAESAVWWASSVECHSALNRRRRHGSLTSSTLNAALTRLRAFIDDAFVVLPTEEARRLAERLLAVHPLRSVDALQLASALVWCEQEPSGENFICLDSRLRTAAEIEGFTLMPESASLT